MESLAEIESAAKKLTLSQQQKLVLLLTSNLRNADRKTHAEGRPLGSDYLLAAPDDAPAMTPERVKQLLDESP